MYSFHTLVYRRCILHRRKINTEEKTKVIAAAVRINLFKFLAALAILHQGDLNKRMKVAKN